MYHYRKKKNRTHFYQELNAYNRTYIGKIIDICQLLDINVWINTSMSADQVQSKMNEMLNINRFWEDWNKIRILWKIRELIFIKKFSANSGNRISNDYDTIYNIARKYHKS